MKSSILPAEISWFFDAADILFPNHIKTLWVDDTILAATKMLDGEVADKLMGQLIEERPHFQNAETLILVPIHISDFPVTLARYVVLKVEHREESFIFGFVQLPPEYACIRNNISPDRKMNRLDSDIACLTALSLTRREAEVAILVSLGIPLSTLARQGNFSINTIRSLLKSIFRKTECHSQHELSHFVQSYLNRY